MFDSLTFQPCLTLNSLELGLASSSQMYFYLSLLSVEATQGSSVKVIISSFIHGVANDRMFVLLYV